MRTDTTTTLAPSPTSPLAPTLPPITDIPSASIDRVIDLFVCSPHATFAWIADNTRLTIESVAAILQSERAQRLIPILRELARQRAELIALDLRCPALYATLNVAQDENVSTDLKLRASLALLRGVPLRTLAPGATTRRTAARGEGSPRPRTKPPTAPPSEPQASACAPTPPESPRTLTPTPATSSPRATAISPARATTNHPRTPPASAPSPHNPLPSSPHHALTISPLIQQLARARDSPLA